MNVVYFIIRLQKTASLLCHSQSLGRNNDNVVSVNQRAVLSSSRALDVLHGGGSSIPLRCSESKSAGLNPTRVQHLARFDAQILLLTDDARYPF